MSKGQQESIKIGFAYVGVVLGAGFSTGQEILQFFSNFGTMSYWAVLLSALVIMFLGRQVAKFGHVLDAESHLEPIKVMFGDTLGRIIDYILIFFLYGVMIIMLAGGGNEWSHWIYTALSLLVVSCPCALVISVPLTFFGGIGGAAKAGVLIKGADVFSPYMHATVAAFDKTGTITEGKFSVVECTLAEKDLALVAAAESRFTHPIARSVTAYYTSLGDETPACEHAEDVAFWREAQQDPDLAIAAHPPHEDSAEARRPRRRRRRRTASS